MQAKLVKRADKPAPAPAPDERAALFAERRRLLQELAQVEMQLGLQTERVKKRLNRSQAGVESAHNTTE